MQFGVPNGSGPPAVLEVDGECLLAVVAAREGVGALDRPVDVVGDPGPELRLGGGVPQEAEEPGPVGAHACHRIRPWVTGRVAALRRHGCAAAVDGPIVPIPARMRGADTVLRRAGAALRQDEPRATPARYRPAGRPQR